MNHRVVQWATGAMGRACLRAVLNRPDLALAGVYVYGADKAGRDAGELVRRAPVGVTATDCISDILALDADVVLHAARLQPPYDSHDGDICRLLASGKNVISINGNTFPARWPVERRRRIEEACAKGRSSFMGAGLNPGFAVEKFAVAATGVCLDVRRVTVSETVLCHEMRSPDYVFDLLGFGSTPGAVDPNADGWPPGETLNDMFEEVVACIADRLGFQLDGVVRDHRMLPATRDLKVGAGIIVEGTVSHLDWRWRGVVGGAPVINLEIAWVMEKAHVDAPSDGLWRIRIDGTPSVNVLFSLTAPEGYAGKTSLEQLAVAGAVLNAIPYVVAAPPGAIETPLSTPWRKPV